MSHDSNAAGRADPEDERSARSPDDELLEDIEPSQTPTSTRTLVRRGIALCLSGGGYRAAIFHLGALTRLNELGVLPQVNTYSCVSGGSIIGGYLARRIKQGMPVEDHQYAGWDEFVAGFLPFVRRDVRSRAFASQLKFWDKTKGKAARCLEAYYAEMTGGLPLKELPYKPRFVFCAANLAFGNSWVAERWRVGDYQTGYVKYPPDHWSVARAIAASSCFPPIFAPVPIDIPAEQFERPVHATEEEFLAGAHLRSKVLLTDGGVYDNLGVEPVWKTHKTVLVSDGGKPLQHKYVAPGKRLMRYGDVVQNQVNSLRKRWVIDTFQRAEKHRARLAESDGEQDDCEDAFDGAYWGIMSSTSRYADRATRTTFGYSDGLAKQWIANIRTDLDSFSPNEIGILMKHGYELAEVAIQKHASTLVRSDVPMHAWPPPLLDESRVTRALRGSPRRNYLSLLFPRRGDDLVQGAALVRPAPKAAVLQE